MQEPGTISSANRSLLHEIVRIAAASFQKKTYGSSVEAFLICTLLPDGTEHAVTHTVAKMAAWPMSHADC